MDFTGISGVGASAGKASPVDEQKAFRDADFMKIMLAELTQQDPFKPQETSKIVENMQKLQDLANTRYEKFRNDQRWAQELFGKTVNAQEMALTEAEYDKLKEKGLNPGRGYLSVSGPITSFRNVDETIWVNIDGKDYSIDNVRSVSPMGENAQYLAELSVSVLGRKVGYIDEDGKPGQGIVTAVENRDNVVTLELDNGEKVPFDHITKLGLPL